MREKIIFIVVGIVLMVVGGILYFVYKKAIDRYYTDLIERYDIREFIENGSQAPGPEAILTVSAILTAIGLDLFIIGLIIT